jgi:hypothetical protein
VSRLTAIYEEASNFGYYARGLRTGLGHEIGAIRLCYLNIRLNAAWRLSLRSTARETGRRRRKMSRISNDWNQTLAGAKKILGPSGKVSAGKMGAVFKSADDGNKQSTHFEAARAAIEKVIADMQAAAAKVKIALSQADDEISDDDYNLDPKKPDEKKKIDQVQTLFSKFFADQKAVMDDYNKTLDDLDRHIIQLKKYKAPA